MGNGSSKVRSRTRSKKSRSGSATDSNPLPRRKSLSGRTNSAPRGMGPVAVIGGSSPLGLAITRHLLARGVKDVRMINEHFLFPPASYFDPASLPAEQVTQTRIPDSFSSKWDRARPTPPTQSGSVEQLVKMLKGVSAVVVPMSSVLDQAPPISKAFYLAAKEAGVKYVLALSSTAAALPTPTRLSNAACGVENALSLTTLHSSTGYTILRYPPLLLEDILYPEPVRVLLKTNKQLLSPSIPARLVIAPMSRDDVARAAVDLLITGGKASTPSSCKIHEETFSITGMKTNLEEMAGILGATQGVGVDNGSMRHQISTGWARMGYSEQDVRALDQMCYAIGENTEIAEEVFRTWVAGKGGGDFGKVTSGGMPLTAREFVEANITAFQ